MIIVKQFRKILKTYLKVSLFYWTFCDFIRPMIRWTIVTKSNIESAISRACQRLKPTNRISLTHPRNPLISRLILSFIRNPTCYLVMATASLPLMSNPIDSVISGHIATFYCVICSDKWYLENSHEVYYRHIISDIPLWNESSRVELARIIKCTHSFISFRSRNICADGKREWPNQIPTVENDFRDIAKTFISLRIFSVIEEKSIRDGCPSRGLIRTCCYVQLRFWFRKQNKNQRFFYCRCTLNCVVFFARTIFHNSSHKRITSSFVCNILFRTIAHFRKSFFTVPTYLIYYV